MDSESTGKIWMEKSAPNVEFTCEPQLICPFDTERSDEYLYFK
jgi:hypothetical protein